jgi:hypothetical protein
MTDSSREAQLPPLVEIHEGDDFMRRLPGILATQGPIRETALAFDALYGHDGHAAAQKLAFLQVQIFTDLTTQVRKAMRPFILMERKVYSYLEDEVDDEEADTRLLQSLRASEPQSIPKETKLPHLTGIEELSGFNYHLCGLIDALDEVREAASSFAATCGVDDEDATTALGSLNVELFFHLVYHLKKLKGYFIRLNREVYTKLSEELSPEED